jgi:hypothetical protein
MSWGSIDAKAIEGATEFWTAQRDAARAFMATRLPLPTALLEISAQHPLRFGATPGNEFRARLDMGIYLFDELSHQGIAVQVYVPGSRHQHEDIEDFVSLSHAGCAYLRSKGLPEKILHGDDLNARYKGKQGVYGSADEAYVAASFFRDAGLGRLVSVMSPAQVMRKSLYYLAFGVYPMSYAVPDGNAFHDYVAEALASVPHTLFIDHDLQSEKSGAAARLRSTRDPNFGDAQNPDSS